MMIVGLRPKRSARKPSSKAPAAMPAIVAYWKAPAAVRLSENSRMISGMTLPTASVVIANVKNMSAVSQRISESLCFGSALVGIVVLFPAPLSAVRVYGTGRARAAGARRRIWNFENSKAVVQAPANVGRVPVLTRKRRTSPRVEPPPCKRPPCSLQTGAASNSGPQLYWRTLRHDKQDRVSSEPCRPDIAMRVRCDRAPLRRALLQPRGVDRSQRHGHRVPLRQSARDREARRRRRGRRDSALDRGDDVAVGAASPRLEPVELQGRREDQAAGPAVRRRQLSAQDHARLARGRHGSRRAARHG